MARDMLKAMFINLKHQDFAKGVSIDRLVELGKVVAEKVEKYLESRDVIMQSDLVVAMVPWIMFLAESFDELENLDLKKVAKQVKREFSEDGEEDKELKEWQSFYLRVARWLVWEWNFEVKSKEDILAKVKAQIETWWICKDRIK